MILIHKGEDELSCDECGAKEPPAVVAFITDCGQDSVWVCYACLSKACGLVGGYLVDEEAKEEALR